MAEFTLKIKTLTDNKLVPLQWSEQLTAEDVCITLCKQLNISTVARHLFALRESSKCVYLHASATFEPKTSSTFDLRIRFKVGDILWLRKIDIKAFDYYFHQARNDVLDNKIPDLVFEKYRRELIGLGVTDMYRVMLEKDIPRESVESEYKKYIPKEVLKKHMFFIKKPIHEILGKIGKSGHDAWYVKEEYLKQLEMMSSDYPIEEYKALTDQNGSLLHIIIRVTPFHPTEPGVKYCIDSKREKWVLICSIEELGFISIRMDCTVEIYRKNGIPFYMKFTTLSKMYSFVSLLDGYYRLSVKWTFNICKEVSTPSLLRLQAMKCHGPVGGEFSYAKLEEKRGNKPGCFILRESESKYNIIFVDICMKDSLKPKTYKIERLSEQEFIFNDDLTRYNSIGQLMNSYADPQNPIYLLECLPPSEYDKSPLLLCKKVNMSGDSLTDGAEDTSIPSVPVCINIKDLQVYKNSNCLKWDKKRKHVKINNTVISLEKFEKYRFPEINLSKAQKQCRNPDGDLAGPWCFVQLEDSVKKEYCDIPFCDDQDCMVFTRNNSVYGHYTNFPKDLTEFTFGVKLWDPDSYMKAKARLVLSLLALPVDGKELDHLGSAIEILLSNNKSTLLGGNKDEPEYESTHGILKASAYTFFTLSWDHGFLTLSRVNHTKPIFLQEYKTKKNLLGHYKSKFRYYAAQGDNVMWSFPFCDDDNNYCDVHTTGTSKFQQFWPLRETDVGHDLVFQLRAFHSSNILLVPSPVLDFPNIKISLGKSDNYTRIMCTEFDRGPTLTLFEGIFPQLLTYWKWGKFSLTLFSDKLHFFWKRDVGTFMIMEVKHDIIKLVRWFSSSSDNSVAHWTFFCEPPANSAPPQAFLPECSLNSKDTNYMGTQDVTSTGLPCLPWSAKKLIPDSVSKKFKDSPEVLLDMVNYCRNFKHETEGTYCYAVSENGEKRVDKHFCGIRKCKSAECRMAGTGNDYIGKVSVTRSNRTCQFWKADLPIDLVKKYYQAKHKTDPDVEFEDYLLKPTFNVSEIPVTNNKSESILPDLLSLLNNSTKTDTASKEIRELNEITSNSTKVVGILKDITEEIKSYINESLSEKLKFVKVHNVELGHLNDTLFADMLAERAQNFCRNPTRSLAGSWCYTMDKLVPKDVCNVPDCDRNEECTVFVKGDGHGRDVFILPQWKEQGIHGGLKFSVKQWNPDVVEGLQFEIRSFMPKPKFKLVIGADYNEKIILYRDGEKVKEKTLPHIIPAGKWASLWFRIRRGEFQLGYEGVANTLFEWTSENTVREFVPVYVNFMSLYGNTLGLFFKCEECHTENTTTHHYGKIMPIGIWTVNEQVYYKNLTLRLRGSGDVKIRLMHLPGSGDNFVIKFVNSGKKIEVVKNIKLMSSVMKKVEFSENLIPHNKWVTMNITFAENQLGVFVNESEVITFNSSFPLMFYYFSIAVGENSWVAWVANCEVLDIDGPPLNGGWSKWSSWECTVTCGGGDGYRTRTCSNPRPNIYGELCHGSPTTNGKCNEFECGDLSPETFREVRNHLQNKSYSLQVDEGNSIWIRNNVDILARVSTESPEAYYDWSLNGKFIRAEIGRVDFIGDDIVIKNSRFNDSGVYICMLYRVNKQRLILHVVTLSVVTKKPSIITRATLPINLDCKALSLGYVYSDLAQIWYLNKTQFKNYGVTTLAAYSNEFIQETNTSLTGDWRCVIEQRDLKLNWTTVFIKVKIKKAPNMYTHLMEDPLTKPIFGHFKSETTVQGIILFIIILVISLVAFGLFAYLRWGTLPDSSPRKRVKSRKRSQKKEGSEGFTSIYKGMWRHAKGKKMEVAMKILKTEHRERFLKDFLEMAGKWAFVQSNVIVRFFGLTLTSQLSVILEYVRLGPLDQYLRDNSNIIKAVDLVEAVSNLASALWHLSENGIVHGHIRCRKLLVSCHDQNSFTVKLADPGIHSEYLPDEVHWLPLECYPNMNYSINAKTTAADVWAFGTTVWEIFMYGESIKRTDHVNAKKFYASGKRLSQPQNCPSDIYKLMLECWDADMHRRKQPQAISRDINQILYQVYNSRRVHAYAKIKNLYSHSTESIYSNYTESTNVTNQEDLISVFDMHENDSDLSNTSLWSVNSWSNQDATNNEACGLSNMMSNFNYSTATTSSLESINAIQSIFELDDDCNVVLQGRIGQGFYGEVYKGTLEHIGDKESPPQLVAIKKLKSSAVSSCLQDFEREISIMKTLKHPNIVQILGVLQEPEISLVMEYVNHGSLQSYLKIYKDSLTSKQLLKYASDIAEGMHYLGSKNIVHRDLAARNILVVDENHVKISDFGLAQVVINDYYILTTVRELPIKWYALESLRDGKFSVKSDVWSYGVTMCEMFSNGDEPNLPVTKVEGQEQQLLLEALEKGTRFPCPIKCPQSVYVRVIYPCWYNDPHIRPGFQEIGVEIEKLLKEY